MDRASEVATLCVTSGYLVRYFPKDCASLSRALSADSPKCKEVSHTLPSNLSASSSVS